jgi:ribonuclease R
MPIRFTQRIVEHLAHAAYKPSEVKDIARDMRIDTADRDDFGMAVRQLADQGRVVLGEDGLVRLPSYGSVAEDITGTFRLNPRGFGFIIPDVKFREGDLFVPPGSSGGAISGDQVRASVYRAAGAGREGPRKSPFVGRVIEVVQRGQEHFVGRLYKDGRNWFVEADGRALHDPVLIRDPHAKTPGGAKGGDKVVIELLHYPDSEYVAEGVIVKVLGEAGRPDVETQAVIAAHGLRMEFSADVMDAARSASRSFDVESGGPWEDREDLTGLLTFTIDPPDARDYDDAISIDHDAARDEWSLGVHIADVSHFVQHLGALDEEARLRGNSVYLPRLVIPMLPEVLSNGVCSLQEGVHRFTKSVFITFDGDGRVIGQRLASTVIKSRKRMTYLEAQAVIDGDLKAARGHAKTDTDYTSELVQSLKQCDKLAKILRKRRLRDGMIVLNLPEVDLVFDEHGHVIDAVPEDGAFTHTIIEMFMVEANEALARTFADLHVSILRRVHPEPAHGDIEELRVFALAAHVRVPDEPSRRDLQQLLEATRHTPAARAIHFAVLRTLAKASYSPALVGHFALASDHYGHFTSPIRRYPDLTLHRVMQAYLDLTDNGRNIPGGKKKRDLERALMSDGRVLDEGVLIDLGRHCSETEVEAETAERELREFLVLQFLQEKHLGDEFTGVITGMIGSGLFVSIDRFLVEGKVAPHELPSADGRADRWIINQSTGRATAQRSGAVLAVGDVVTVQIVQVDLGSRHLDLLITKMPERSVALDAPAPSFGRRERAGARRAAPEGGGGGRGGPGIRAGGGGGGGSSDVRHGPRKDKKHRKGFKQGRRGKRSR